MKSPIFLDEESDQVQAFYYTLKALVTVYNFKKVKEWYRLAAITHVIQWLCEIMKFL